MTKSPTQGEHAQPDALRLAESITRMDTFTDFQRQELDKAAAKLRSLHAQVAALTAAPGVQAACDTPNYCRSVQRCTARDGAPAQPAEGAAYAELPDVDALAQEIRRVDGANKLGAGALAEALMPFLRASHGQAPAPTPQADSQPAVAQNNG